MDAARRMQREYADSGYQVRVLISDLTQISADEFLHFSKLA